MRLRIVTCVRFDRYVYEDVAQWTIEILEFMEEEYVQCMMSGIPVFIANGLVGVLSCHNDLVPSELVIPAMIENHPVCGVIQCGFYGCKNLTKVVFSPKVAIVYPIAFSYSGLKEMVFNNEIPVFLHISSIDHCDALPPFDRIFESPFPGKYMFRGGQAFEELETLLRKSHFLN